jgi:predicted ATPase
MHLKRVRVRATSFPSADAYPFTLEILRRGPELSFDSGITCFQGENGTGKSTLLLAIARACGIHVWREESAGRIDRNPHADRLSDFLDLEWTAGRVPGSYFGSDSFRDFSRSLEEWAIADPGQLKYFGGHSLLSLSHGQSLMSYFRARYAIEGLYFLDEPETALSPRSQAELVGIIQAMAAAGHAQFIIASHSPFILSMEDAAVLGFDKAPLAPISYEESESFKAYRDFFRGRDGRGGAGTD